LIASAKYININLALSRFPLLAYFINSFCATAAMRVQAQNDMSESTLRLLFCICVLLYFSFVCISAFAYFFASKVHCGSAVRSCQALPGPDYSTPLVCVPAVIGLLAVWRHNKPKTNKHLRTSSNPRSIAGVPFGSARRFQASPLLRTTCMRS